MNPKTIEDLLDMPAEVEKMTDAELEKHLARYFPYARPTARMATALAVGLDKAAAAENGKEDPFEAMERKIKEKHERDKQAKLAAQAGKPIIG